MMQKESNPYPKGKFGLRAWHSTRVRIWSKIISVLIAVMFVFPYLAFAFEPATYPAKQPVFQLVANGNSIQINPELGRVVSSYRSDSARTIVFIHDLHCNYEVQSNIAALLQNLAERNRLKLVGVEGESKPINVDKLATFPIADVKVNVGQYFLKRGRVTGAEYQAATGKQPLILEGIESQDLYEQNKDTLAKFLNEESQGYCEDLQGVVERLKAPLYSVDLAKLDHLRQQYDLETVKLETYCNQLLIEAQRYGVSLAAFPVLSVYAADHRLPSGPNTDYDKLLADAEALDQTIREKVYTSPDQRQLDHSLKLLKVIENMVNISATASDLDYYRTHREEFSISALVQFLDNLCYRNAVNLDLEQGVLKLDDYLKQAAYFYEVADKRSDAFVQNTLRHMEKQNQTIAVMITGGFHAAQVEAALHQNKVSYVTVKPRMTRTHEENPYFSLLRNERAPLEKLLAQNENIFAPYSAFNDAVFRKYMDMVMKVELRRFLSVEEGLSGDASEKAYRQAVKDYKENYEKIQVDYRTIQGNTGKNIYVFSLSGTNFSIILRPSQISNGEAYPVVAAEELGHGFMFQIVENAVADRNRAEIFGEESARISVTAPWSSGRWLRPCRWGGRWPWWPERSAAG